MYAKLFVEFQESLTQYGAACQLLALEAQKSVSSHEYAGLEKAREKIHSTCVECLKQFNAVLNTVQKNGLTLE